jgi:choline dehydrogenase-like flavoprotein
VDRVLHAGGRVTGVAGRIGRRAFRAEAQSVVIAAGGIGSPRILQASGFTAAGEGMAMDTTVMVYGFSRAPGTGEDPPMTWSWEDPQGGFMLSTLIDPWLMYPIITAMKSPRHALTWPQWRNALGVMIKLKDEISGGVFPDGRISKPLTARDRERQQAAEQACRRILVAAGADAGGIFMTPLRGTHPSATVRVGTMVDERLETPTRGLFVCDASVFPEALGRPTVLTIIGLARRLARHLAG